VAQALPYVVGGIVLILYFVWMLIEMSNHADGGGALPLGIFGAVLLGVVAGGASLLTSRNRTDDSN
jgi:hypothetical protein